MGSESNVFGLLLILADNYNHTTNGSREGAKPRRHDNHLIAAGPLVGCLGEGGLPTGPGHRSGVLLGLGGPAARARVRAQEAG
jgi:hypothetical protein